MYILIINRKEKGKRNTLTFLDAFKTYNEALEAGINAGFILEENGCRKSGTINPDESSDSFRKGMEYSYGDCKTAIEIHEMERTMYELK